MSTNGKKEHEDQLEDLQDEAPAEEVSGDVEETSSLTTSNVAAAAMAAAKGATTGLSENERKQPATIVRRRRGVTRAQESETSEDSAQLSVVRAPTLQEQGVDPLSSTVVRGGGGRVILEPRSLPRNGSRTGQSRAGTTDPPRSSPGRKKRTAEVRPMPPKTEQVSLVPPNVPESTAGLDALLEKKAILVHGGSSAQRYRFCYDTVGALVRERLGRTKKRHELILDALREEELFDVVALALFEAPRGLSLIALQTHELVLHYLRQKEPFTRSLRSVIQAVLSSPVTEGLFSTTSIDNWALTDSGRAYVDENFRYALQEAAKEKPRRYSIDDCSVFLPSIGGAFPPLFKVHAKDVGDFGCAREILRTGPILRLIQQAIRSPKSPVALVLLDATIESAKLALGGLYPLVHSVNRGSGALAPSVHIPGFGNISIPPNVHVIIALNDATEPSSLKSEKLNEMFGIVTL